MKAVNREMTDRKPRTREQRRADTLAKLSAPAVDVWVATDQMRFLVLRPQRIQAWQEVNELPGRTLMRGGAWIT
jgi:hypothetical protein